MALLNFLGNLGGSDVLAKIGGNVPGSELPYSTPPQNTGPVFDVSQVPHRIDPALEQGLPTGAPVQPAAVKHSWNGQRGWLGNFLGHVGDALLAATGHDPIYAPRLQQRKVSQALQSYQTDPEGAIAALMQVDPSSGIKLAHQHTEEQLARQRLEQPDYRTVNNRLVRIPFQGDPETIYTAPEDFQIYADQLGLEPGTPEYESAMKDYVLRGQGPTAYQNRTQLEGVRQQNRSALVSQREQNFRSRPVHAPAPKQPTESTVIGGILAKQAAGQPLTPGEQQVLSAHNARGRGGGRQPGMGGPPDGAVIRNPKTGQTAVRRGGQWVDQRTGQAIPGL